MSNAPIILFCYNRIEHLKKTINSIKKNQLSKSSNFIIFSDGPKNTIDKKKVFKIRKYLKKLKGFKKIEIVEEKKNKGLSLNIIDGLNLIFKKYSSAIILEDDLVVSKNFLTYMNEGLARFKNDKKVISIHGYSYPFKADGNDPEYFFLKGADCWGWATWAKSWTIFENNGKKLKELIINKKTTNEFNFNNSFDYMKMLNNQIKGKNNSWAIRWYASAFLKNKLTLYPKNTFVKNIGTDGSGTHGSEDYDTYNIKKFLENSYIPIKGIQIKIKENTLMKKKFEVYFNTQKKYWKFKKILKNYIFFLNKIKKLLNILLQRKIRIIGNYDSWKQALKCSKGYSDSIILKKTIKSFEKVITNQAKYERDSFLFYSDKYDKTLLSRLNTIKKKNNKKINVCDFGGSLGSLYFQHKKFFTFNFVDWNILEQVNYVKYAKKNIKINNLHFYDNLNLLLRKKKIDIVLFSSSLQYLENPYFVLGKFIQKGIPDIIIHRSPFTDGDDVIKIQNIPKHIYKSSYPIRILSTKKIINLLSTEGYKVEFKKKLLEEVDGYSYKIYHFKKSL